ncbi:MAG: DUF5723 family protein [Sphingobacteriales bacterium]
MRSLLLVFSLIFISSRLFAQEFSQYNTGTLYDSFENPSQKSFTLDTSRSYAFNFFVPNFDVNFTLTGDAQQTLKNRYINNSFNNSALQIGAGNKYNYVNTNANAYSIMFKAFTSFDGNVEVGFFIDTKLDGRGAFTDESIALLNGSANFPYDAYNNIFNSRYSYQLYNEAGATYREQVTKQLAFGIKVGLVSGMSAQNVHINQSSIVFDKAADSATLRLQGTEQKAGFSKLPFSNPGIDVSIGTTYRTPDAFIIQTNLKNLGFIHWNKYAETYNFSGEKSINDLTSPQRETNVYNAVNEKVTGGKPVKEAYNTPLDGRFELSASKSFLLGDEETDLRYSPTLILSKELFYSGFTTALVSPIQYQKYSFTLVTSYEDKLFKLGTQLMIKSYNGEFFIGTDQLPQTISSVQTALKHQNQVNKTGVFTGSDISIGFSMKFGPVIEHPMNASYIPMGEKGFLGRLWDKLFKKSDDKALED